MATHKIGNQKKKCERYRTDGRKAKNRNVRMDRKLRELQKHYPDRKYEILSDGKGIFNIRRKNNEK